jgi:hypothetical protein
MNYTPHAEDSSLVVGDNGHVYAATRLPESGWQFREAWEILDVAEPGVIPVAVRLFMAGLIAGALDRAVADAKEAFTLLDLINAEFQSDPTSVQCFDLRIVERVNRCVIAHKPWAAPPFADKGKS